MGEDRKPLAHHIPWDSEKCANRQPKISASKLYIEKLVILVEVMIFGCVGSTYAPKNHYLFTTTEKFSSA